MLRLQEDERVVAVGREINMKRHPALDLLTFLCIPCWLGTVGFWVWHCNPRNVNVDWSCPLDCLRLVVIALVMVLLIIPTVIFIKRACGIVLKNDRSALCEGSSWPVTWAVVGILFWGFWSIEALLESRTAHAAWQHLLDSYECFRYGICLLSAYLTPFVTTLYFVVLAFHRSVCLLNKPKASGMNQPTPLHTDSDL